VRTSATANRTHDSSSLQARADCSRRVGPARPLSEGLLRYVEKPVAKMTLGDL